ITIAGSGVSGAPDAPLTSARFNGVLGLLPDSNGNVLFTDYRSSAVRFANLSNATVGSIAPSSVGRVAGGIFGCNAGATALTSEMEQPHGLARDGAGDIYISDFMCNVIWKLSSDFTTVTQFAGSPTVAGSTDGTGNAASFNGPTGLVFSSDGYLYVTDYHSAK